MSVSRTKKVLGISTVIFFMIILHFTGTLRSIEDLARRIIRPGSQVLYQWSTTIGSEEYHFNSLNELEEAYIATKNDLIDKQVLEAEILTLRSDNEQLREQLAFFASSSVQHIGATVVGKNIEPLGSTLVINRGEGDGIAVGDPVIVRNGILVGTIVQTHKSTSIVKLLNDNQSKVAATVGNRDKSLGLVEGGYGISTRMNFIPQNEQIFVGDLVITSGLTENIPKGLLIGTIETVEKEAYQPFQEAIVTPAVNLDKIDIVSVLIQKAT